jgi:hypothetical protein
VHLLLVRGSETLVLIFIDCEFDVLQVRFFHKVGTMTAPVTDTEKLVWSVLEAERPFIRFSCTFPFSLFVT